MSPPCLMQQVLGEDWQRLPPALKKHHLAQHYADVGHLDIDYPPFMQACLNLLSWFGVLFNHRGKTLATQVVKAMDGNQLHWKRSIQLPDGRVMTFNSRWQAAGDHAIIEYVNAFLGLKMRLHVTDGLIYEGAHLVLKLGVVKLPIPEWLLLGHCVIIEKALDEDNFHMEFHLQHPLLGRLYCYRGRFHTISQPGKIIMET